METLERPFTMDDLHTHSELWNADKQLEIDAEVFDYFLEVLPPVFMSRRFTFSDGQAVNASFGFAEGWEPIVVFWHEGDRYFMRRSKLINRS